MCIRDRVKVALTATPALHTTEIFGEPVYTYSYREAVIDGWLVDHDPPYLINTDFIENDAQFKKGETLAPVSYTHLDVYKRQVLTAIQARSAAE